MHGMKINFIMNDRGGVCVCVCAARAPGLFLFLLGGFLKILQVCQNYFYWVTEGGG